MRLTLTLTLIRISTAILLVQAVQASLALAQTTQPAEQRPVRERTEKQRGRNQGGDASLRIVRDISYAQVMGADKRLISLDVYAPREGTGRPVVVWIHGGGWAIGDKANVRGKPAVFTGEGCVFVSINYRLSPAVKHPVHVQDVARAIAWVHDHINEYGGDPDNILLIGHSAGAHLAALVATDERRLEEAGAKLRILKGVVLLDGAGYDIAKQMQWAKDSWLGRTYRIAFGEDSKTWEDASPIKHVGRGKDIPPFLIFHAGERLASRLQSEELAGALRQARVRAEVAAAPDKNHMTLNRDLGKPGDEPTRRIVEFFRTCTQNQASSKPAVKP